MAIVQRRRRFHLSGLGNVPIPGLSSEWSLGDPASDQWGASYYNGSKIQGYGSNGAQTVWLLANGSYGPEFDQATLDAITAAANANFASPEHAAYAYDQAAASSPEPMRSVLLDPEWRAIALQGGQVVWENLSGELQDKIKAVPALYASLTDSQQFATDVAAGKYAAPTTPTAPARYLQGGVETYADGTPVPGGYNAAADQAAQIAAQTPPAASGGSSGGGGPTFADANPSSAGVTVQPLSPGGPAIDLMSGGAQLAPGGGGVSGLLSNPWLLAGIGAAALLAVSARRRR